MPTTKPRRPTKPASLQKQGRALWNRIVDKYDLRPDELVTLEDVCLITDMISELEDAWSADGRPMTSKGSMGQKVIHPLIGEIRVQRMARNALWRQLKLPDEPHGETEGGTPQPNQHRDAANSRWAQRHGA